ncbi:MAG: branched-chain amino acid ABC transporter permease [Anaerolineae bacterium]
MAATTPTTPSLAERVRGYLREHGVMLLLLAAMILFPFVVGWLTGSPPVPRRARDAGESSFWQSVLAQVYIFAILAMSYNLLFGFTGIISFGHGLFFGTGAYMVAIGVKHLGLPFGVALLLALLVSGLLSLILGLVSLRIKGVYFAIFTLAFAQVFFILARNRLLADLTGAEDGFFFTAPEWLNPVVKNRLTFYYVTLVTLVLVYLFIQRLINSPTGRVFQAIRENEQRASTIGFNTLQYKLFAIIASGMLASLAGTLHVVLNNKHALPSLLSVTYTVDPLLATLLGGIGTFIGPGLGAALLHLGETALRGLEFTIGDLVVNAGDYWFLLLGISFIVVVMVFPQGLVGTWRTWRLKRMAARRRKAPTRDES